MYKIRIFTMKLYKKYNLKYFKNVIEREFKRLVVSRSFVFVDINIRNITCNFKKFYRKRIKMVSC